MQSVALWHPAARRFLKTDGVTHKQEAEVSPSAWQTFIGVIFAGLCSIIVAIIYNLYGRMNAVEADRTKHDEKNEARITTMEQTIATLRAEVLTTRNELFDAKQAHARDALLWQQKEAQYQEQIADLKAEIADNNKKILMLEAQVSTLQRQELATHLPPKDPPIVIGGGGE